MGGDTSRDPPPTPSYVPWMKQNLAAVFNFDSPTSNLSDNIEVFEH